MRAKNRFLFAVLFILPILFVVFLNANISTSDADTVQSKSTATAKPAEKISFNDPLKYAYVTEKGTKNVSVLDVYDNDFVGQFTLDEVPELIAVSSVKNSLFYAKKDTNILHYLNVSNGEKGQYAFKAPIQALAIKGDGVWIAYASNAKTVVFNTVTKQSFEMKSSGAVSFIFQPNSDNKLFIGELFKGKLSSIDLTSGDIKTIATLPQSISELSFMPNGLALFFNSGGILHRYALLDEKLETFDLGGTTDRPYITSDSLKLLTLSQDKKELVSFHTYTFKGMHRYTLPSIIPFTDVMASGWLEQIGVVVGKLRFNAIDFSTHEIKEIHTTEQVSSTFVHPDSKTLYAALVGSSHVAFFDMKIQKITAKVNTHLAQPDKVIMLQSNTLCH